MALLVLQPNISKEVTTLHPLIRKPLNEFWNEVFHEVMLLDDYHLPLECQSPLSFDISCDDDIRIFNKLMNVRSYGFNYLETSPPKSLKLSLIHI